MKPIRYCQTRKNVLNTISLDLLIMKGDLRAMVRAKVATVSIKKICLTCLMVEVGEADPKMSLICLVICLAVSVKHNIMISLARAKIYISRLVLVKKILARLEKFSMKFTTHVRSA